MQLTATQESILIGSLLGDGSITKNKSLNSNCCFVKPQCDRFKEYIEWHYAVFGVFSSSIGEAPVFEVKHNDDGSMYVTDKIVSKRWIYRSKANSVFTKLRNVWYPNGIKIIPRNIRVTPLVLAIWFCDDGQNLAQRRSAYLYTNGFSFDDCEYLLSSLETLGISSNIANDDNKPIIRIKSKSYIKFIELIKPYIPFKCFEYKISLNEYIPYKPKGTILNVSKVQSIIHEYNEGSISQKNLAEKYGVSKSYISKLLQGERWKELSEPRKIIRSNNTSGCSGVSWDKHANKWVASIVNNGKRIKIGRFFELEDAIKARKAAEND